MLLSPEQVIQPNASYQLRFSAFLSDKHTMYLALYTFGQFTERAYDPANDGFYALNDRIFDLADETAGLIARSGYAADQGNKPWGEEVYPSCYVERGDGWSPATLSLWADMESLHAFTYSGLHAKALGRGREWFIKSAWPPLVLWWHGEENYPTWSEGVARHKHLHEHGPTATAFTFKAAFDAAGLPATLDRPRAINLRISR
jgi:hypothetical protein